MLTDPAALRNAIGVALEQELQKIGDEEIAKIIKTVKLRVREATTNFAARVCERMSFDTLGQELIIRVEFNDIKT